MNALTTVQQSVDAVAFDDATRAVNAWRGNALQCFAQAEAAVSETLLGLASHSGAEMKVGLRRLVGQRFGDLADVIDAEGPFAKEGAKAAAALAAFRQHEGLRTFLCHGVAKVALDRHGQWIVVLKVLAFRGHQVERSLVAYDKREAEGVLAAIKAASSQLAAALQSLRARTSA
jgi:hypothetical protein